MDLRGVVSSITGEELRWPWLGALAGALVVGLATWWLLQGRRPTRVVRVAHTQTLTALPRYRVLVRRRLARSALQLGAAGAAVAGCLLLVARPSDVQAEAPQPNRDLVICLDVSGSMLRTDAAVVGVVAQIVDSLPGDRVGLTVFDSQSVVKFPLTDDRAFVRDALTTARDAFESRDTSYYKSTHGPFSSLIGDGLHTCLQGFDRLDERRGRVVLLASDNQPYGRTVHALSSDARLARERGIVVHALGVPSLVRRERARAQLVETTATTHGGVAILRRPRAATTVVTRIDRVERRRLAGPPRDGLQDRPRLGVLVTAAGVGVLALTWRRRRA